MPVRGQVRETTPLVDLNLRHQNTRRDTERRGVAPVMTCNIGLSASTLVVSHSMAFFVLLWCCTRMCELMLMLLCKCFTPSGLSSTHSSTWTQTRGMHLWSAASLQHKKGQHTRRGNIFT